MKTYITFKVPSELYVQTDCVINDIARALKTGFAPCGDGCDYKLTTHDLEQLRRIEGGETNVYIKQTTSEIQRTIYLETGIKTSVKNGTGSMRGYVIFSSMFQDGKYPEFPFSWRRDFQKRFPDDNKRPMFVGSNQIHIYYGIQKDEPIKYNTERKPKPISEMKVREWGSENSQMRLDKKASRYAKKRRGPSGDRMVKYW